MADARRCETLMVQIYIHIDGPNGGLRASRPRKSSVEETGSMWLPTVDSYQLPAVSRGCEKPVGGTADSLPARKPCEITTRH